MKWISILIWLLFWAAMLYSQTAPTGNEAFKIGFAAYQQGNYDLAIKNYNQAISAEPGRNYFYYNRGLAYKAEDKNDLALADFRQSCNLKPTAEAYYEIGAAQYKKADFTAAKSNLEKSRALRSDFENLNFYLGLIYFNEEQYDKGTACLEEYTKRVKSNPDAYFFCALCQAKTGKRDAAAVSVKLVSILKGNDPKYYYKMYQLYAAIDDNQSALNNLTMLIETGAHKAEYYKARAALYEQMGDKQKSDEDLALAAQEKSMASK